MAERHDEFTYQIKPDFKIEHPRYNKTVKPEYLYDIGLIKLPKEIVFERELLPVCLSNTSNDVREDKFVKGVFGVVTGWGRSKKNGPLADSLKQMQMSIKDCSAENATVFDKKTMFCAGDKVGNKFIDACEGNSGGPFSVRMKTDKKRFIQIGIVSSGIGCKHNDRNGFYTKLTADVLDWIKKVTST